MKDKNIGGTMDHTRDFIHWLGRDMALNILMCLDDPSDLVRIAAVSYAWRQFVIANGLCKKLCLRMFPEASSFAHVVDIKYQVERVATATDDSAEWACLQREHRVYAFLCRGLASSTTESCISGAICASSTDNYPEESIKNTLVASPTVDRRASYWSSKGESNPAAPEALIYKLSSQLCLITEVHLRPFQAYFQFGFPIYSAMAVRFHMGHPKVPLEVESDDDDVEYLDVPEFSDDKFVWTYTSQEFPMVQENRLQKFKLPKPVLCTGGILKVELLGRVQTQEVDRLYYICITHVQVIGRPLPPAFGVDMIDEQGKCTLKYKPEKISSSSAGKLVGAESSSGSHLHRLSAGIMNWEQMILNIFPGAGPVMIDEYDSDQENID